MNAGRFIADTQYGFASIELENDLTVQCCLVQCKDGNGFKKEINVDDAGENDGICGDVNQGAFKKYGQEECFSLLISTAKKNGIRII